MIHHTKAERAIIATPGGGTVLKACLAHGVKALVIAKNDAHMKHLRDYAIAFMLTEAKMNAACTYHVKRGAVISRLGLDEDDTQPSPLSKAMTTTLDIDDTEVPTHQQPSDAIVVRDQAATSGEQPDASEADPGSDNDASESGSGAGSGSDSGEAQSEEDPLNDLFGEGVATPKATGKGKGRGKKTKPEEEATSEVETMGKGTRKGARGRSNLKGKGRGKKTNPEESVSEPPQKRRKLKKTQESLTDLNQLQELAVTFA